eukprot:6159633-Alexandrium_andersonii.AAC.1
MICAGLLERRFAPTCVSLYPPAGETASSRVVSRTVLLLTGMVGLPVGGCEVRVAWRGDAWGA